MSQPQLPPELARADNLPTPSGVALQVMRLAEDPNAGLTELGDLMRTDPSLTVRILRSVNSAANGLSRPVDSVPRACALLGLKKTRSLAMGFAVVDALPLVESSSGLDLEEYWLRSAITAAAAESMAMRVHPDGAAVAFVVGLLSELGRLVLASCLTSTYRPVLEEEPWPSTELERRRLGFSNLEVADALLASWHMPNEIRLPIAHRDQPEHLPRDVDVNIIRLARILPAATILANEWVAGSSSRGLALAGRAAGHYLMVTPEVFAGIVEELRSRVEDLSMFIDAGPPGVLSRSNLASEASERLKQAAAVSRSDSRLGELLRSAAEV